VTEVTAVPAIVQDALVAAGLLALLLIALEIGFLAGIRSASRADVPSGGQVGAIQGAELGLLGLLLAFSFAAAAGRFFERQDLIIQEANAIGTTLLRADLLEEPHRSELRTALRDYTAHRIAMGERLRHGVQPDDAAEIDRLHARMWKAALAGVTPHPALMLPVLDPLNQMISLHTLRLEAGLKRVPPIVMGLLIACSALAIGTIGYGIGLRGKRRVHLTLPLAVLVGSSLWLTMDLDRPRAGLIQLSDQPFKDLRFDGEPP
jgi:hypothetical protein